MLEMLAAHPNLSAADIYNAAKQVGTPITMAEAMQAGKKIKALHKTGLADLLKGKAVPTTWEPNVYSELETAGRTEAAAGLADDFVDDIIKPASKGFDPRLEQAWGYSSGTLTGSSVPAVAEEVGAAAKGVEAVKGAAGVVGKAAGAGKGVLKFLGKAAGPIAVALMALDAAKGLYAMGAGDEHEDELNRYLGELGGRGNMQQELLLSRAELQATQMGEAATGAQLMAMGDDGARAQRDIQVGDLLQANRPELAQLSVLSRPSAAELYRIAGAM